MFRKHRGASAAVGIALVGALMTACASPATPPSEDLVTDPAENSGEITFTTWWSYADEELISAFKEKYPNVEVNLDFVAIDAYPTKIQALASSGDLPDVFAAQAATLTGVADAGKLYDLNDALESAAYEGDFDSWKDSFNPDLLSGANAGLEGASDHTWGVPFNAISVASIYNQDAFAAAGVKPPTSFDELLGNCEALAEAGYIPMSLTAQAWISWWVRLAWDQTMQDDAVADFSVDSPNYIKAFEIVEQMANAGCWSDSQITTDIAAETSLFLQGKTAQFVSVPENFLQAVADGAGFPISTYVLPALDGKEPSRILGGGNANVIVVSEDSPNKSAAIAFAKFLTSVSTQESLAASEYTIPSIEIDVASSNPLMSAYLEAASQGFVDPSGYLPNITTPGATKLDTEVLPSLMLGNISAAEAAAQTADIFEK